MNSLSDQSVAASAGAGSGASGGGHSDQPEALALQLTGWFDSTVAYVVALSGGVDSAVVCKALCLSGCTALAATSRSESVPESDLHDAQRIVSQLGISHRLVDTGELTDQRYRRNDARRCYYCKSELFEKLRQLYPDRVILTGTNADDLSDFRPGLVAAKESNVRAPLAELGITKEQVRSIARHWRLDVSDKPASPCLASRIARGVEVTPERLAMIQRAEAVVAKLGLQPIRVRLHADATARIEVPVEQLSLLTCETTRQRIVTELKTIGFRFVTLDLEGFRSGSLNPIVSEIALPGEAPS